MISQEKSLVNDIIENFHRWRQISHSMWKRDDDLLVYANKSKKGYIKTPNASQIVMSEKAKNDFLEAVKIWALKCELEKKKVYQNG